VNGRRHGPAALALGKNPRTHWSGSRHDLELSNITGPCLRLGLFRFPSILYKVVDHKDIEIVKYINPLNPELNPICYLLALLGAHHFLHVTRIRVKSLALRLLMSYIYGAPILDVSRSHTTTQHSR